MLKTILAALDTSELSDHVIGTLQELQLQPTTQVILSHVIPSLSSDLDIAADRPPAVVEEFPHQQIEKQLRGYQSRLPCTCELEIVAGEPADEIIRLANIYQADLIVIGNRGLTGLNRILQQSVSSQVVADAPCSVLVVRPRS